MGEKKFREIEYEELLKIKNGNFVIATGGGAYIYPKSHYLINKYGFTIWIKASQKIIVQRTINNKNRPLLQGSGIITKVKVLLRERNPIYSKAKLTVFATKENKIKKPNWQEILKKIDKVETAPWLSLDTQNLIITVNSLPLEKELPQNIETHLIVEFYSR